MNPWQPEHSPRSPHSFTLGLALHFFRPDLRVVAEVSPCPPPHTHTRSTRSTHRSHSRRAQSTPHCASSCVASTHTRVHSLTQGAGLSRRPLPQKPLEPQNTTPQEHKLLLLNPCRPTCRTSHMPVPCRSVGAPGAALPLFDTIWPSFASSRIGPRVARYERFGCAAADARGARPTHARGTSPSCQARIQFTCMPGNNII
jgi:hypothetical protein